MWCLICIYLKPGADSDGVREGIGEDSVEPTFD